MVHLMDILAMRMNRPAPNYEAMARDEYYKIQQSGGQNRYPCTDQIIHL